MHNVFPEQYQQQLDNKLKQTLEEFKAFSPPKIEVFSSPPDFFRQRAEFKIWHENDTISYAMFEPGQSKKPYKIDHFPVASKTINQLMPKILAILASQTILKAKLFQMEFLTSLSGDVVVTLIYHKPLDDQWLEAAKGIQTQLKIDIIGRSRKQKIIIGKDYIHETFKVGQKQYTYQQIEGSFTQPNGVVCQHMLNWAQSVTEGKAGDLLELYCGNGNFTLPLAQNFRRVLATEVSKTSVKSASYNIKYNNLSNINVVRMSSEEFTEALNKKRSFRRLSSINLDEYKFSTVLVDPPRAGLDEGTLQLVKNFKHIVYISCNPTTLRANLAALQNSHCIQRFALFDQFPYTDHRECGVLLSQN